MKNAVVFDEYNEIDIKPSDLLQEYIRLTEQDVRNLLLEKGALKDCACTGCGSRAVSSSSEKFGMTYKECSECGTLYISPRPDEATLSNYYKSSAARTFWRGEFSKTTGNKRREKIVKPRFEWIVESTQEYLPRAESYADIGATQYGYIEEVGRDPFFRRKAMVNPLVDPKALSWPAGIKVVENASWETELKGVDVVSLFEVADRVSDPDALLNQVNGCLNKNGLCFMTAILSSGFDVKTLKEKSDKLYPPDRLNVFSVEGLRGLFGRHGFECLEFSTPGIFDVEIVRKALSLRPDMDVSPFAKYWILKRDAETRKAFQQFLQENLLSSYGRILLRKVRS